MLKSKYLNRYSKHVFITKSLSRKNIPVAAVIQESRANSLLGYEKTHHY